MAIVRSLGVGQGKKSAGMLTYRSVRGRTIASRRVVSNNSNTVNQAYQRNLFASASKFMLYILSYIECAFEKSKFGSARNNYMKSNPDLSAWGGVSLIGELSEGAVTVGDALVISNYGLVEGGKPGINFVSRGSAGGVQVQPGTRYETTADWNNVGEIGTNAIYDSVTFNFPSGVNTADLEIDVFAFPAKVGSPILHENYKDKFDLIPWGANNFGMDREGQGPIFSSISFSMKDATLAEDALIVPVLRVKGKVVTNNVMTAICNKNKQVSA